MERLNAIVNRIGEVTKAIRIAQNLPDETRKQLETAVIGHKNWNSYGLQEIRGADLHRAALDAVTDKLVSDLAERKRAEIAVLADELDVLRKALAIEAATARFELLNDVIAARTWSYQP